VRGGDESEERKGNGARWLDFGMGERTCLAGVSTREASSGPPANAWSESTWSNPSQISSRLSKPSQPHPRKAPGWPSKAAGGASKAGQQEQATVPTRVTQNFVFARSRRFADLDFRVPSGLPVGIDLDNRAANLPLLYFAKTHRCFSLFVSFFSSCTFKFFHYRHNCLLAWPSTISSLPHTTTPLPSRPPTPTHPSSRPHHAQVLLSLLIAHFDKHPHWLVCPPPLIPSASPSNQRPHQPQIHPVHPILPRIPRPHPSPPPVRPWVKHLHHAILRILIHLTRLPPHHIKQPRCPKRRGAVTPRRHHPR